MHKKSDSTLFLQSLKSWLLSLITAPKTALSFSRLYLQYTSRQTTQKRSKKPTRDGFRWDLTIMMLYMRNICNGKRPKEILSQKNRKNCYKKRGNVGNKYKFLTKNSFQSLKIRTNLCRPNEQNLIKETSKDVLCICKTSIVQELMKKSTWLFWIYLKATHKNSGIWEERRLVKPMKWFKNILSFFNYLGLKTIMLLRHSRTLLDGLLTKAISSYMNPFICLTWSVVSTSIWAKLKMKITITPGAVTCSFSEMKCRNSFPSSVRILANRKNWLRSITACGFK